MRWANTTHNGLRSLLKLMLIVLALTISACGFHLRGYADLSFKTIYIENSQSELGRDLIRSMKNSGVKVVNNPELAEISLEIMHENKYKRILSLGSSVGTSTGAVREFELFYTVSYRLKDKGNKTWAHSQSIENRRDFSYADAEVLGKSYEEANLYDNMRSDTVRQIMRALSAHQPSVSNQSEETETPK